MIWQTVEGFSKYEISRFGQIVTKKTGKLRKNCRTEKGYLVCQLISDSGKKTTVKVHRMVAKTYLPNPEGKPIVHHRDGDRENNSFWNLEWVTAQENTDEAVSAGKIKRIIGKAQRERIVELRMVGMTQQELASAFGVSRSTIQFHIRKEGAI